MQTMKILNLGEQEKLFKGKAAYEAFVADLEAKLQESECLLIAMNGTPVCWLIAASATSAALAQWLEKRLLQEPEKHDGGKTDAS